MSLAPVRPPLVSLNALRAFEAAARLGGFAAAAEELRVTPAAVAQQVKVLEAWVDAPLFERRHRGVTLTPLGARALTSLAPAFDQLGAAARALRTDAAPETLRIAALPALAQLWLAPRLPDVRAALGAGAVSVVAMERPPNLLRELFDLAVFYEPAPGAADVIDLGPDQIFPVASPDLARRLAGDLAAAPRLADANWGDDWAAWPGPRSPSPPAIHSLFAMAVAEAKAGAGVLMARGRLVAEDLANGTLHRIGDLAAETPGALMISLAATTGPTVEAASALAGGGACGGRRRGGWFCVNGFDGDLDESLSHT